METIRQGRLYRLAKRLSLGRLLRYGVLWARYGLRRGQSALLTRKAEAGQLSLGPILMAQIHAREPQPPRT